MKTKPAGKLNLFVGGKDNWEETGQFKNKVNEIKKEVTDKYSQTLLKERNLIRRILINVQLRVEIWRRIEALSSLKNLHIAA